MNENYFLYVDYYGDYSFSQIKINDIDYLIFATLAYIPYKEVKNGITINELGNIILKINKEKLKGNMGPKAYDLLEYIYNKKRYKNIRVYNFHKIYNKTLQFGAISFRYKNNLIVSYEGTNNSIAGWVENFRLVNEFPTATHKKALEYLKSTVKFRDKNIYLCGHSKGGNSAMVSAYLSSDRVFNKIRKIYNFDGPGFRREEFDTDRFKKVNNKTLNYLPDGSLIGILLYNKKYNYLETDGLAFQKHYPFNWKTYGGFFKSAELSTTSQKFKYNLDKSLLHVNYDDYNICVKALEDFFESNNIQNTSDFQKVKFDDVIKMFNSIKGVDKNTKDMFMNFIKSIFFGNRK